MSPLRRQNPREEPGALAAHAGIGAGGEEQSSSLPRQWYVHRSRVHCAANAPIITIRTSLASDFASIFWVTSRGEVAVAQPTLCVETTVRQSELKC